MKRNYAWLKRGLDIFLSAIGIVITSPLLCLLAIWIKLDSQGPILFKQERVGYKGRIFMIYKFRTMIVDAEKQGLLLTVNQDNRVTRAGRVLRKYKLDEFPQLFNVLKGDMSLVGPRPEVPRYVQMYNEEQKRVLHVRPGITDYASIKYSDENSLLCGAEDPEKLYVTKIMPDKLQINLAYIEQASPKVDAVIILKTLYKIVA